MCESQVLINSNGNIFCGGFDSCVFSQIFGNNYDMNSEYYNDKTFLRCDGDGFCFWADIYYFDSLYCNSLESCDYTRVIGVENLYANGYWSLAGSDIESSGMNMNMTVHLQSDYAAYDTWIYCMSNDTCNIICSSYRTCFNTTLICNGTCHVICNENEGDEDKNHIVCPIIIGGVQSTVVVSSSGYLTTDTLHLTTQSSNNTGAADAANILTYIPTFPQHPTHPGYPTSTATERNGMVMFEFF